jgi:hypothetical protein
MIRHWERALASELMRRDLDAEFQTEPLVEHFLMLAGTGDIDVRTAMVKIIQGQALVAKDLRAELERLRRRVEELHASNRRLRETMQNEFSCMSPFE